MPRFVARTSAALVLSLAATAAWISPAALAASARPVTAGPSAAAFTGFLSGVTATSASNAWAVGGTASSSVALHWNGHAWARVTAPGSGLGSVAASGPGNAWVIGRAGSGQLIAHWNGHSWKRSPAPLPKGTDLLGVATTSPSNAWVVGEVVGSSERTLTLHWNGHSWKRVPSPDPHPARNTGDLLISVTALSGRNAWAVGAVTSNVAGPISGLILHWNGRSWARVSANAVTKPSSGGVGGITATSAGNVWAAGCDCAGGPDGGVIGRWNGRSWTEQRTPDQHKFGTALSAISASSRRSAFAVGSYCKSACTTEHPFYTGLILRWTGSSWKIAASPLKRNDTLIGVAVASASSAWAVGDAGNKSLILHWNGRSWQTAS